MAVRMPAGGTQINFHVAGARRIVTDLDQRAAKIRAAFQADKSGMKDPDNFSVGGFEPVTPQALVLPDDLEQAFRRRTAFVAQSLAGDGLRPPGGVEIFVGLNHVPDFLRRRPVKVKPADKLFTRIEFPGGVLISVTPEFLLAVGGILWLHCALRFDERPADD
jgi:hypothetical protein